MKTQMDELKEIVGFGLGLGNAIGTALEDGKVEVKEATLLLPVALQAPEAFSGVTEAFEKLKSLTPAEASELQSYVIGQFNIPQDKVEVMVEAAIGLALDIWARVQVFIPKKVQSA